MKCSVTLWPSSKIFLASHTFGSDSTNGLANFDSGCTDWKYFHSLRPVLRSLQLWVLQGLKHSTGNFKNYTLSLHNVWFKLNIILEYVKKRILIILPYVISEKKMNTMQTFIAIRATFAYVLFCHRVVFLIPHSWVRKFLVQRNAKELRTFCPVDVHTHAPSWLQIRS